MKLQEALKIAEYYRDFLRPFCSRIEIAGSIRRKKPEVGDIELVCIPNQVPAPDLLNSNKTERDPNFIRFVDAFDRIKGNGAGKYVQIKLPEGINLDLFITTAEQWGVIFLKKYGYNVDDGILWKDYCHQVPCYEEIDFFKATHQEYLAPEKREK